ncbi:MAG TPA: hypothetical protein VNG71_07595, partial [Pyrinomonadaceae bacterium]|nr:hypothetical protein [Pyrinomonadaceae bacterium]
MRFKYFVLLNSLVVFLFGAAFMLRPLDMMALYGVVQSGWGVTGLLAVTLIGFGLVLSAVAYTVSEERQRPVTVALLLANLLAFAISAAQQQAIWNTRMGWVTAGGYLLFVLGYAYLVVKGTTARHAVRRA